MRRSFIALLVVATFAATACNSEPVAIVDTSAASADSLANETAAKQAKVAYVAGINSNNLAQFLSTLTDDVVYVAPNTPVLAGKAAVSEWVRGYLDAYVIRWEKTSMEFVVRGDLAYERYSYKSVDTPRAGGPAAGTPVVNDTGNGINVYRRLTDGTWKLARDSWATDRPAN